MFTETKKGVVISIKVVPRASRTEVVGRHGDSIKIRLQAPPVDGKANKELCRFLARLFEQPIHEVHLISGTSSQQKRVRVDGVSATAAEEKLLPEE